MRPCLLVAVFGVTVLSGCNSITPGEPDRRFPPRDLTEARSIDDAPRKIASPPANRIVSRGPSLDDVVQYANGVYLTTTDTSDGYLHWIVLEVWRHDPLLGPAPHIGLELPLAGPPMPAIAPGPSDAPSVSYVFYPSFSRPGLSRTSRGQIRIYDGRLPFSDLSVRELRSQVMNTEPKPHPLDDTAGKPGTPITRIGDARTFAHGASSVSIRSVQWVPGARPEEGAYRVTIEYHQHENGAAEVNIGAGASIWNYRVEKTSLVSSGDGELTASVRSRDGAAVKAIHVNLVPYPHEARTQPIAAESWTIAE